MYDVPRPAAPVDIGLATDELTTLTEFLEFHRSVLAHRAWGLSQVHMIEEYARHCGHADYIRQSIDGAVG